MNGFNRDKKRSLNLDCANNKKIVSFREIQACHSRISWMFWVWMKSVAEMVQNL